MKSSQLLHYFIVLSICVITTQKAFAQRTVSPTLETFYGAGTINVCAGTDLHLFAFGDYLPTHTPVTDFDYVFYRIRNNNTTTLRFQDPSNSFIVSASDIQVGDVYYAKVYNYTPTPVNDDTNQIVIGGLTNTTPVNQGSSTNLLLSNLDFDTTCGNESFQISALGGSGVEYIFYQDGVQLGARSLQNFVSINSISTTTLFSAEVFISATCSTTGEIQIDHIQIDEGTISGTQTICVGSVPNPIQNAISGSINGISLAATNTSNYVWESSTDNVNWVSISSTSTNGESYQPPALNQTTYFRRAVSNTSGQKLCAIYSNVITISVANISTPTLTPPNQFLCQGDVPSAIDVTGTVTSLSTTYQWQMSTDGVVFANIGNNSSTLTFSQGDAWTPTQNSFYRAIVSDSSTSSCTVISATTSISFYAPVEMSFSSGPIDRQIICPGNPITPITFTVTNSTIITTDADQIGLQLTGPIGGVYTLSGTPSRSKTINLTASQLSSCSSSSFDYDVRVTSNVLSPSSI